MRLVWLAVVSWATAIVARVAYRLSGGYERSHADSAWRRLSTWAAIVSYGADSERGYRQAGLWPPRGGG